jgi:tetratricopeptide (TPR) repeat protein
MKAIVTNDNRNRGTLPSIFERTGIGALLILMAVLSPFAFPAPVQDKGASYRQAVLSIQREIEANNLDGASALITSASKEFPSDGGIENLLGVVEIQRGHVSGARQAFSAAIRHDPRLAAAYLNLSRIDMQAAASDLVARNEALRLSEKVLQLQPASDEANYQIAAILNWTQSYSASLEHLARLSASARAQIGAEALLCADEAALGHREAADRAAASLAANTDLTEQDANTCLPSLRAAHRADLIESIFAAAAARQPLSFSGLRILGLAQEAEGKLEQARATLESAFVADSRSAAVLVDLTRIAETAKDYQGALGYLAHARELQPADASLPYEFGSICIKLGLYAESRKAIAEAVRLAPDNPEYNFGMGTVVSFSQDPSEALPYLEKYHALRSRDPEGILELGTTCFRAKDFDSAVKWLKQVIADPKTSPDAYFYLGRIARQEGHLDEATDDLKRSLALRPDHPDVLAELGQICVTTRSYPAAQSYFERAIRLDRDNYSANFGLLQLYARTYDERREQQAKRFDEIKDKKEEQEREMMRVIEIRPDGGPSNLQ